MSSNVGPEFDGGRVAEAALERKYKAGRSRILADYRYAQIWADGNYLGARVDGEKTALLCVEGAGEDEVKELLGMDLGYRESTESCSGALISLWDCGMDALVGAPYDISPAPLEPPRTESAGRVAECAACRGKAQVECDIRCADAVGLKPHSTLMHICALVDCIVAVLFSETDLLEQSEEQLAALEANRKLLDALSARFRSVKQQ